MPANCPCLEPARTCPYPHITLREDPILILSSHLRLGLWSGLFPSDFPTKPLYTSLLSPKRARCSAHPIIFDLTTRIIFSEQYRSLSFSFFSFIYSPATSSLLGPNIAHSTLFSNTLNLRFSLNMSDQASHTYITKGKKLWFSISKSLHFWMECKYLILAQQTNKQEKKSVTSIYIHKVNLCT